MSGEAGRHDGSRIQGLDGLRAISILLVLIGHGWLTIPLARDYVRLGKYFGNASLGVTTFFVISGYLITYLLRNEWNRSGTISLKSFYARRILRIFPALYTFVLVLVAARLAGLIQTTSGDLVVASTFLTNYKHLLPVATNDHYWFVGHFWSLSLEEQFYLLWPATMLAVGLTRAWRVALAIVLGSPFLRVATYLMWPEARGYIGLMLHTAADPIMVGCLVALVEDSPAFTAAMQRLSWWGWALAACVFLGIVSPWLMFSFEGAYTITVGTTLNGLAIAFVMSWVIRHPGSALHRLLSNPALRHVGVLSYSLYLWQQFFLAPFSGAWVVPFPFNFLACFAAAQCSFAVVERPFLALRSRFRWTSGERQEPLTGRAPLVSGSGARAGGLSS